jgi:ABC-type lipoprotein release transport system permease subunit
MTMMMLLLLVMIHVSTIEITTSVTGIGTTKHGECVNLQSAGRQRRTEWNETDGWTVDKRQER